jgi:GAF domain-containing protein
MEGTRLRQETEERLRELTTLYRATSREGWEAFRQAAELPIGYLFNRTIIQPAEDLWMPEIAKAVEQSALVSPAPSPVAAPKAQESPNASATVAPLSVRGEVVGALGVYDDPQRPMSPDDLALVESVSEQVALALESARLFDESKRARLLLDKRVRGLDCLNDIGLKLEESVSMPNFLQWVAERIPAVMQYPDLCVAAIEYGGQVYGAPEALTLPRQMVQGLRRGGELIGRVCIAYTQEHDFLDEESALLGDIARRVNAYLENQRLLSETQARARREQVLREITARVRSSTDPDAVMRALVQELGTALGRSTFARLGSAEELSEPKAHRGQALVTPSARGNGDPSSAGG